jgi:hypothetical protein
MLGYILKVRPGAGVSSHVLLRSVTPVYKQMLGLPEKNAKVGNTLTYFAYPSKTEKNLNSRGQCYKTFYDVSCDFS